MVETAGAGGTGEMTHGHDGRYQYRDYDCRGAFGAVVSGVALARPEESQRAIVTRYLRHNAQTVYGRLHGFEKIRSAEDYQQRVPITDYEDYRSYIERIAVGEPHILTAEPVVRFAATSGSAWRGEMDPLHAEPGGGISPWHLAVAGQSLPSRFPCFVGARPIGRSRRLAHVPRDPPKSQSALTKIPPTSAACSNTSSIPPSPSPATFATFRRSTPSATSRFSVSRPGAAAHLRLASFVFGAAAGCRRAALGSPPRRHSSRHRLAAVNAKNIFAHISP